MNISIRARKSLFDLAKDRAALGLLAVLTPLWIATPEVGSARPEDPPAEVPQQITAELVAAHGSGVTGFVQVTEAAKRATVEVGAQGLEPNRKYSVFTHVAFDGSAPGRLVGTFTADAQGNGGIIAPVTRRLKDIGSVSLRLGPGYGAPVACAEIPIEQRTRLR